MHSRPTQLQLLNSPKSLSTLDMFIMDISQYRQSQRLGLCHFSTDHHASKQTDNTMTMSNIDPFSSKKNQDLTKNLYDVACRSYRLNINSQDFGDREHE